RQLIGLYGDSMQGMVPHYLEASLEQLQRNQSQLREAMAGALAANPFAEIARRNMEMFSATTPGGAAAGKASAGQGPSAAQDRPAEEDTKAELAALKAQLADLQRKLDKLG
ncbi:MAG TPA: PHB accumulation regulatory domain-containing protein, partial [Allosphingosinicella sp.]|nr:PHB accumulation regulatory domain-containing protein [Allosphingosinicella sp.]